MPQPQDFAGRAPRTGWSSLRRAAMGHGMHRATYEGMTHFRGAIALFALIASLLDSVAVNAESPAAIAGTCQVRFSGSSTLHDFEGTAPPQPVTLNAIPGTATYSGLVRVPVTQLDTDNSWRDDKLHSLFEAERYSEIIATFDSIDPQLARPAADGQIGTLPFQLRIRAIERPVRAVLSNWSETPAQVAFDATFTLSLAEFELPAPTVAGLVRVDDSVVVEVHVELAPSTPTTAATQQ